MRSRRGGLDVAKGPKRAHGFAVTLVWQEGLSGQRVASWGMLPGPVVIEQIRLDTDSTIAAGVRFIPMAFASHVGRVVTTEIGPYLRAGIPLLRGTDSGESVLGVRAVLGISQRLTFWPRIVIPWWSWAPGLILDDPVGLDTDNVHVLKFSMTRL